MNATLCVGLRSRFWSPSRSLVCRLDLRAAEPRRPLPIALKANTAKARRRRLSEANRRIVCLLPRQSRSPNLTMVYQPTWDTSRKAPAGRLVDSNSYDSPTPRLPFSRSLFSTLQHSWDLFGITRATAADGLWDGSARHCGFGAGGPRRLLGRLRPTHHHRLQQGDGNVRIHDWFHEATRQVWSCRPKSS